MAKSSLPYGALPIMLGYIHFFSAKSIAGMLVGYVSPLKFLENIHRIHQI
jgi:hypothetical protein